MSRRNRNQLRDRKTDELKRDVANSYERPSRRQRENNRNDGRRLDLSDITGLDRHRLNDLYERSSI